MLRTRVIPVLLLLNDTLVKTVRFGSPAYIGDPVNTVRIFNELLVDELLFLDITATRERRLPNQKVLAEIATECFMPLAYGGGIRSLEDAKAVFDTGFEKVAINSAALERPALISELAAPYGSQAVIVSIDVKKNLWGRKRIYAHATPSAVERDLVEWAQEAERLGAGELLLTSVDREGTWKGFDVEMVRSVTESVSIPVIAHGGASSLADVGLVVREGGASAVGLGSLVVYQGHGLGVLINFPAAADLKRVLQ